MNERIALLKQKFVMDKIQKERWQAKQDPYILAECFSESSIPLTKRSALRLLYVLDKEEPVVYQDEKITFTRTVQTIPELVTENEVRQFKENHWMHELGDVNNINVDFTKLMSVGFDGKIAALISSRQRLIESGEFEKVDYISDQIAILERVLRLVSNYKDVAKEIGNEVVFNTLSHVPAKAPRTFLEALQFFRIIHFTMWAGRNYHNTIGRFDQYMWPYLENDLAKGYLTEDAALELLEEFFLTFNRDSDLYPGMQQGDNGQSLVLGGVNPDGSDGYNLLSKLCLKASLNLSVIDPKINLRVNKNTPIEVFRLGSKLTKQGLGFPQYSNDDIVIPGLMDLGYEEDDAYNYVVAACWEFIIPGKAFDIPNLEAVSFTKAIEDALLGNSTNFQRFSALVDEVKKQIKLQVDDICNKTTNLLVYPAPFMTLLMSSPLPEGTDISQGSYYNNYGLHGTGISSAADSLSAIKKIVFEDESQTLETLREALKQNFVGYEKLQNELRYNVPKMGNDDDYVDSLAVDLLAYFAEELDGRRNERGGRYRAGTGSAMYYIWHAKDLYASPDGRKKGEGLGCNYSPSLFSKCAGPVSIIKSFTKPDLKKTINGGPLTLELHDTLFRSEDSLTKVAYMVKSFIDLGGHQLQLNAINRDTLLEAQKEPENFQNLIVRVWGWSGYFVDLDKEYQNHVIERMELTI